MTQWSPTKHHGKTRMASFHGQGAPSCGMLDGRLVRGALSSPSDLSSSNRNSTTAGASDTACPISMTTFRECTVHLRGRLGGRAQLISGKFL